LCGEAVLNSGSESEDLEDDSSGRKSQRVSRKSETHRQITASGSNGTPRVNEGERNESQRKKNTPISTPHE
jgi:hypothetical protein